MDRHAKGGIGVTYLKGSGAGASGKALAGKDAKGPGMTRHFSQCVRPKLQPTWQDFLFTQILA